MANGKILKSLSEQLNGFTYKQAGNVSNWDLMYPTTDNTIAVHDVAYSTLPIGAPQGAYRYGNVYAITRKAVDFWSQQLVYIPDCPSIRGIYIKTNGDSNWLYISGTSVPSVEE